MPCQNLALCQQQVGSKQLRSIMFSSRLTLSSDDVFSSRASIDAIFHSPSKSPVDSVDVLQVGLDDAQIHLRIFDSFEIGTISLRSSLGASNDCRFLMCTSDPLSSSHVVVAETRLDIGKQSGQRTESVPQLQVLMLDLRFITSSGRYLSLLASKSTQLQNLLRYIQQIQLQIDIEWRTGQDLPSKYMRNINEALEEKCQCDFLTAAYHLLVTGNCYGPLKEFLVDEIGERVSRSVCRSLRKLINRRRVTNGGRKLSPPATRTYAV